LRPYYGGVFAVGHSDILGKLDDSYAQYFF
jgi:hypothetical protein